MRNLVFLLWLLSMLVIQSCDKDSDNNISNQNHKKVIPKELALKLAERISFDFLKSNSSQGQSIVPDIIPNREVEDQIVVPDKNGDPALYIFNYAQRAGFVVISADERHEPVCAVIESGRFEEDVVPSSFISWFEVTIENIEMLREGLIDNTAQARTSWLELLDKTNLISYVNRMDPKPFDDEINELIADDDCCPDCPNYPECLDWPWPGCGAEVNCDIRVDPCEPYQQKVVGPLLSTQWGQGCSYNECCPVRDCQNVCRSNENAWTGCVATAICQVLRYWSHPSGFNYDYVSMPDNYGNAEVQRMMRDAGKSVNMNYSCTGSGAYMSDVEKAFKHDFNYTSAKYDKFNYQYLQSDLDNGRPVILDGCRSSTNLFLGLLHAFTNCHAWVCDGYMYTWNACYNGNMWYHMNWGWNGVHNGWYLFNNWRPGLRYYQFDQDLLHNINP